MSSSKVLERHKVWGLLVILFSTLLSACSSSGSGSADNDNNSGFTSIAVVADGRQEVPATGSDATATGTLSLNVVTRNLSGSIAVSGMTVRNAHIHNGLAGNSGDIEIALLVEDNAILIPESTVLTESQFTSLLAGELYLNLHSDNFPGGEIRGQLLNENMQVLVSALDGQNEVPPVVTNASGFAYVTLNEDTRMASIVVRTEGIVQANAAHVHLGYAGTNGAFIITLDQVIGSVGAFGTAEPVELSSENYLSLLSGETYINVHSADIPTGELRAQLTPSGVTVLRAVLTGSEQVPAVASAASGIAYVTVNVNTGTALSEMTLSNIDSASGASIGQAPIGEAGTDFLALSSDDGIVWQAPATVIDAAELNTLLNGGAYIKVDTVLHPTGEIRGQLR